MVTAKSAEAFVSISFGAGADRLPSAIDGSGEPFLLGHIHSLDMRFLVAIAYVLAISLVLEAGSIHPDDGWISFVLAVDHFDPEHQKDLTVLSREVTLMHRALQAARRLDPHLAKITLQSKSYVDDPLLDPRFSAIITSEDHELMNATNFELVQRILKLSETLEGCARRTETVSRTFYENGQEMTLRLSTTTTFDTRYGERISRSDWNESPLAQQLRRLQVDSVSIVLDELHGYKARVSFTCNRPRDTVFLAKALTDSTDLEAIAPIRPARRSGEMFGELGNRISVNSRWKGPDLYEPIELEFTVSWGDCIAGCMFDHTWLVRVDSSAPPNNSGEPVVKATLLRESGDALPR